MFALDGTPEAAMGFLTCRTTVKMEIDNSAVTIKYQLGVLNYLSRSDNPRRHRHRDKQLGVWGRCKPPNGVRGEAPAGEANLWHFRSEMALKN